MKRTAAIIDSLINVRSAHLDQIRLGLAMLVHVDLPARLGSVRIRHIHR